MAAGTGISQPSVAASIASIESAMPATMLDRDPPRPLRDHDRFADPVEPVGEDHHIGGLRRGAGADGGKRDADIGRGQRRRIVDAVADHDGRVQPLLGAHRIDLVGRHAFGQHRVEIERGTDRRRGPGAVAGDHDDARDAGVAQQPDRPRRVGPKLVGEQQGADRPSLDRDEYDQRRSPRGAPDRPRRPFGNAAARTISREPAMTCRPSITPAARAHGSDLFGQLEAEAAPLAA